MLYMKLPSNPMKGLEEVKINLKRQEEFNYSLIQVRKATYTLPSTSIYFMVAQH